MSNATLLVASVLTVGAALGHAVLGEQRLVRPLIAARGWAQSEPLISTVIRLAWHWTTALILFTAYVMYVAATEPASISSSLVMALGLIYLGAALIDLILSKARHDAWPPMALIGFLTIYSQI